MQKRTFKNEEERELAWDNRELGAEEKYARRISRKKEQEIEKALGLQAISIRFQTEIIDQLKILAKEEGIGYQPLIRQIVTRYVRERISKKAS